MSERRTDDATLIEALRILSRTITTEDGVIPACLAEAAARLETLVEERRWIPVGERLPPDEVWVDVASRFGDCHCLAWHDGEGWINVEGNSFPSEVTHWRKRGPGLEAKA